MLAAGLAAFGLLYITQAVQPSIGATFGVTAATAGLTVSLGTGALALTSRRFPVSPSPTAASG